MFRLSHPITGVSAAEQHGRTSPGIQSHSLSLGNEECNTAIRSKHGAITVSWRSTMLQPNRTHDGNLTFGINLSASPDVHVVNRHGGGDTKIFAIFWLLLFLRHGGTRPCYPTLRWKYGSEEDQ